MNSRELMSFAGGDVPLPKPTRADLLLSAAQWVCRARENIVDAGHDGTTLSALNHVDRILKELADV